METITQLYETETSKKLLLKIIESIITLKFGQDNFGTKTQRISAIKKIKEISSQDKSQPLILLRGIKKSLLKEKLIEKLNSNDSLYEGLFLVGEKAKNFLEKSEDIPNPIKNINSIGIKTPDWIFNEYSKLKQAPIDLAYFKNDQNKKSFSNSIKGKKNLIDYYLFGLHTFDSAKLVNFVSTTLSPKVALNNNNKDNLLIFLWLPENLDIYIDQEKLKIYSEEIKKINLPVLINSFHPEENEYSFKGFIPPHFILGVHDLDENSFIMNPGLIAEKINWVTDGVDVNKAAFSEFIQTTAYKRFLILTNDLKFVEKNVC